MHIRHMKGSLARVLSAVVLASIGLSSQGCGPITAHSSIARAHIAIEAAEGARAKELAIFEYESAHLYLRKAKLEEGLSSFQSAIDLARLSRNYADSARARALKSSQARPLTPTERRRMMLNQGSRVPTQPIRPNSPKAMDQQGSPSIPPMPKMPAPPQMPPQGSSNQKQGGM
jgi:hypothetical protein